MLYAMAGLWRETCRDGAALGDQVLYCLDSRTDDLVKVKYTHASAAASAEAKGWVCN